MPQIKIENPRLVDITISQDNPHMYKDEIIISIPPIWIENLCKIYKEKALTAKDYDAQGLYRKKADFFIEVIEKWESLLKQKQEKS